MTIFAPNNAALAAAKLDMTNITVVTRILRLHVVSGSYVSSSLSSSQIVASLAGPNITIRASRTNTTVNNAAVVKADILATNGVVDIINAVITTVLPKIAAPAAAPAAVPSAALPKTAVPAAVPSAAAVGAGACKRWSYRLKSKQDLRCLTAGDGVVTLANCAAKNSKQVFYSLKKGNSTLFQTAEGLCINAIGTLGKCSANTPIAVLSNNELESTYLISFNDNCLVANPAAIPMWLKCNAQYFTHQYEIITQW